MGYILGPESFFLRLNRLLFIIIFPIRTLYINTLEFMKLITFLYYYCLFGNQIILFGVFVNRFDCVYTDLGEFLFFFKSIFAFLNRVRTSNILCKQLFLLRPMSLYKREFNWTRVLTILTARFGLTTTCATHQFVATRRLANTELHL